MLPKNAIQPKSKHNILHLYKPVLVLLLISGFNFKVFKFKPVFNIIAKFYCFSLVVIIAYSTFTCCLDRQILQIWPFIEYSFSVIILVFYESKLTKFFKNIGTIDICLRINKRHYQRDKNKTFLYTVLLWIERCLYTGLYCISYPCYRELFFYLISQLSLLALDLNRVWRFILLDAVRYRLKLLRLKLEEMPGNNFYLYVKDRKMTKENKIRFCLHLYKSVADVIDFIIPEIHASILVSIICGVPKLIINIYHILLVIEGHEPTESLGFYIMQIFQVSFFLFSPSIVVELYSLEVERIRLLLMHELIDVTESWKNETWIFLLQTACSPPGVKWPLLAHPIAAFRHYRKDNNTKEDIQLFLEYTNIRTFRYRIWRCIPVNICLPVEIANLCTTYVIVIINFTHLYG